MRSFIKKNSDPSSISLSVTNTEKNEEIKWSHNSQAARLLKSSRLWYDKTILFLF